ncbi:transporter substrate-binding domain-containing protein [Aestuariibacter sp. AA17]|uniref:Transporter substrate-binding domain-containing protein n=1 Tax=Fluctibacter corallii TaxID=2984329 RepID=A0ABT3A7A9_9ALTE|nr:transporter substrate-binding domain-containing protein [Aestuariibacter sp. AA17]MCV2884571.1 transporter substrate-binding domain-containing protein [Aestuariibacter sp. AA17]
MKPIVLFMSVLLFSANLFASVKSASVCAPEWEFYTEKNGSGLYHDIWKEVFEKHGVAIEMTYSVYERCEKGLSDSPAQYDVMPGCYESDPGLKSDIELGIELLTIVFDPSRQTWNDKTSLSGKNVAWEQGFTFKEVGIVPEDAKHSPYTKLVQGLKMLTAGRVDYVIDYPQAVSERVEELGIKGKVNIIEHALTGPKFYMCFADNENGQALLSHYNEKMKPLFESGWIKALYNKYEDPAF